MPIAECLFYCCSQNHNPSECIWENFTMLMSDGQISFADMLLLLPPGGTAPVFHQFGHI